MARHGDGETPLWATAFGWNALPAAVSPWGGVGEEAQAQYAAQALDKARSDWPWLGPLFWAADCPDRPASDPWLGFALCGDGGAARPVAAALDRGRCAGRGAAARQACRRSSRPALQQRLARDAGRRRSQRGRRRAGVRLHRHRAGSAHPGRALLGLLPDQRGRSAGQRAAPRRVGRGLPGAARSAGRDALGPGRDRPDAGRARRAPGSGRRLGAVGAARAAGEDRCAFAGLDCLASAGGGVCRRRSSG